jgi:hypothetical protein
MTRGKMLMSVKFQQYLRETEGIKNERTLLSKLREHKNISFDVNCLHEILKNKTNELEALKLKLLSLNEYTYLRSIFGNETPRMRPTSIIDQFPENNNIEENDNGRMAGMAGMARMVEKERTRNTRNPNSEFLSSLITVSEGDVFGVGNPIDKVLNAHSEISSIIATDSDGQPFSANNNEGIFHKSRDMLSAEVGNVSGFINTGSELNNGIVFS